MPIIYFLFIYGIVLFLFFLYAQSVSSHPSFLKKMHPGLSIS